MWKPGIADTQVLTPESICTLRLLEHGAMDPASVVLPRPLAHLCLLRWSNL